MALDEAQDDIHPSIGANCIDNKPAEVWIICFKSFEENPLHYVGIGVIILSMVYGFIVFVYTLAYSPQYGTLDYYAYMVMTKRARYFKLYVKIMYIFIVLLILVCFAGFFLLWWLTTVILPSFMFAALSTVILSGIAVSELRKTNEMHFRYEMSQDMKPIYLNTSLFNTADDIFGQLEEALNVYMIGQNDKYLRRLLKSQDDVGSVLQYYRYIYQNKEIRSKQEDYHRVNGPQLTED